MKQRELETVIPGDILYVRARKARVVTTLRWLYKDIKVLEVEYLDTHRRVWKTARQLSKEPIQRKGVRIWPKV